MKIVGEFGQKKHKKRGGSCRASATMLCTGSATGKNGPTVFVMAGERVKEGYSDAFLAHPNPDSSSLGSEKRTKPPFEVSPL